MIVVGLVVAAFVLVVIDARWGRAAGGGPASSGLRRTELPESHSRWAHISGRITPRRTHQAVAHRLAETAGAQVR